MVNDVKLDEARGLKFPEKRSLIASGQFRMYIGNRASIALFLNDLSAGARMWVDEVSSTQVRIVLTKDVDVAHEISAAVRARGLMMHDFNSNNITNMKQEKLLEFQVSDLIATKDTVKELDKLLTSYSRTGDIETLRAAHQAVRDIDRTITAGIESATPLPDKEEPKQEPEKADESKAATTRRIKLFEDFKLAESLDPQKYKEIDEDRYDYMLSIMPPIYVDRVDDLAAVKGFAVSEPYSEEGGVPTFNVYFEKDGKHYEAVATLTKPDGKTIGFEDYNNCEYSQKNRATSVKQNKATA